MEHCKQDMPPPGGYKPLDFKRVPLKSTNPYIKLGAFCAFTVYGWWHYKIDQKNRSFDSIRYRCSEVALQPMLEAERDRAQLKYLKKIHDEEELIMKDVPGWEVGKWKSFPVYFSVGPNEFYQPVLDEIYKNTDSRQRLDVESSYYSVI